MAEEMDKKAAKKAEKARKKAEKKTAKNMETDLENTEEEEGSSSKLAVALVTLVIIIVWLAILALLIKWDVGGFGSTVMRPLLIFRMSTGFYRTLRTIFLRKMIIHIRTWMKR